MPYFNIVAQTSENTVVTEYVPVKHRSDQYQSEAALEQEFGVPELPTAPPYGIAQTDRWFRAIGKALGKEDIAKKLFT